MSYVLDTFEAEPVYLALDGSIFILVGSFVFHSQVVALLLFLYSTKHYKSIVHSYFSAQIGTSPCLWVRTVIPLGP